MKKQHPKIEKLKLRCWVCNKSLGDNSHLILNGVSVTRMYSKRIDKTLYLFQRTAPMGCWLAHRENEVKGFYKDKDWNGWKKPKIGKK